MTKVAKELKNDLLEKVSESVKSALKTTHGNKLKSIEIPKDDMYEEYLEVLVIVPSRSVVSQYMRFSKENPKKAQEILVKNCVMTSKEAIIEDDGLFYSTIAMLVELIPIREGKFGNV
jgi:hypothetical protein